MKSLVLVAAIALLSNSWIMAMADSQRFTVKAKGNAPIIHFTRLHHRVADVDDHQELSVFADGRVRVHNPVYMKNAGTYQYELSAKDMQSLLETLDGYGLMTLDSNSLAAARASAATSRNSSHNDRFHVSDLTATHITLSFANFAKGSDKGIVVQKQIVWNDIPADARRFKDIAGLKQLAAAEQVLLQLTDHSRRNAIRVTGGK